MIFGGFQALRQCKGRGPKKYGSSDAWWQKSWKNFISFWIPSLIINDILCNKVDFWGKLVGWVPITSDDNNTESERWETSPPHMHPAIYTFNKFDKDGDLEMIHMCGKSANLGVYFLLPMHPATFLTNLRWWWFENDSFVRCGSLLLPPCIYLSYFFSNSPAYFDVLKERFFLIFMIVKQPNKTSQNLRPKTKFRQKSAQVSCLLLLPPLMTFDHTVDLVGDFVC